MKRNKLHKVSFIWFFLVAAMGPVATPVQVDAQDWRMWRKDPQRTALQEMPGAIDVPSVKWSLPLGGSLGASAFLVGDVNMEGAVDVVLIRGGRAVARKLDGTLIWATEPLSLNWMLAITDFDSNGRPEVFAGSYWEGLFAIDGTTGRILWRTPEELDVRLGSVFPIDAEADGKEELYVADRGCSMSGQGTGRIYSFEGTLEGPYTMIELDVSEHGYWCGLWQDAGDVDGDGLPEIVALSHDRVIVYDPMTGEPKFSSLDLDPFPYGIAVTVVEDVDGDGRDEIVVASDNPGGMFPTAKRLMLVEWEAGSFVQRWVLSADPVEGAHAFPRRPVADLLVGGTLEIVTSVFDHSTGRWDTLIISGHSPATEPVLSIPNTMIVAIDDIDGDGTTDLLAREASVKNPPAFGTLKALRLIDGTPPVALEIWKVDDVKVPLEPAAWFMDNLPCTLPGESGGSGATLLFRDTGGHGRADDFIQILNSGTAGVHRPLVDPATGVAVRCVPEGYTGSIVLTRGDGSIELLSPELSLLNDLEAPFGVADLVEMNYMARSYAVTVSDAMPLLATIDATLHAVVYDTGSYSGEEILEPAWRMPDISPAYIQFFKNPAHHENVIFLSRDRQGALDLKIHDAASGRETGTFPLADRAPTSRPTNGMSSLSLTVKTLKDSSYRSTTAIRRRWSISSLTRSRERH